MQDEYGGEEDPAAGAGDQQMEDEYGEED